MSQTTGHSTQIIRGARAVGDLATRFAAAGYPVRSTTSAVTGLTVHVDACARQAVDALGLPVGSSRRVMRDREVIHTTWRGFPTDVYGEVALDDLAVVVDTDTGEILTRPITAGMAAEVAAAQDTRSVHVEVLSEQSCRECGHTPSEPDERVVGPCCRPGFHDYALTSSAS